ncbi:MAG: Cif family virulence factor [Gemmatimonadaceae bacterium]
MIMARTMMTVRCLLVAAAVPIAAAAQDTTAAKAALLAADRAAASSEAALRSALAPTATVLLPGREILHGRAAFEPHLAQAMPGRHGAAWTPLHAVVAAGRSFGCTTGVLHLAPADSMQPSTGRYAACWRQARTGAWRMVALSVAYAPPAVKSLPDTIAAAPGSTGTPAARGARAAARAAARTVAGAAGVCRVSSHRPV